MGDIPTSGKMEFSVNFGKAPARIKRDSDTPFSIAVLGDFTGRASRGLSDASQSRPLVIDIDNFEQKMLQLGIMLQLPDPRNPNQMLELSFASLEDFHPDQLLKQAEPLVNLLQLRKKLANPATAANAAIELQSILSQSSATPAIESSAPTGGESTDDTLARLMGKPAGAPATSPTPVPVKGKGVNIDSLIKNIVGSSTVQKPTTQQSAGLAALDLELASQLRSILHHPHFQALEAGWRAVDFLVRNLDSEENLKLYLLDISKDELAADLIPQTELQSAGIYASLYGQPYALLVGNYAFDESLMDLDVLRRMTTIASWLGAPFVAAASPHLIGCESFGSQSDPNNWTRPVPKESKQAWQALRQSAEAAYLGLAVPRFMLRQPYGKGSDEIETLPFEELSIPGDIHERYLWGNSGFLCAYVLVEAFKEDGWNLNPSGYGEIGDLPLHKFKQDGEMQVKPCAEAWLSIRAGDAILSQGLMAILSIKGNNSVRLANLESVAQPTQPLAVHQANS